MKFKIHTTDYQLLDEYSNTLGNEVVGKHKFDIELNSIDELVELSNKLGHNLIIERNQCLSGITLPLGIEIYDDYRE